jgi:hypothetical protein
VVRRQCQFQNVCVGGSGGLYGSVRYFSGTCHRGDSFRSLRCPTNCKSLVRSIIPDAIGSEYARFTVWPGYNTVPTPKGSPWVGTDNFARVP